jgi:hypothetical protein
MRRMGEEEKPLVCAIMWGAKNRNTQKKFVLQVGHSTIGSSLVVSDFICVIMFEKFVDTSDSCSWKVCVLFSGD